MLSVNLEFHLHTDSGERSGRQINNPIKYRFPWWLSGKESAYNTGDTMQETWVRSLSRENPLEEEMATHSSILAWEIPLTEEPGGLQSTGQKSQMFGA